MDRYLMAGFLIVGALFGLWQCWAGWRSGKMFAFDPGGSAAKLSRQDGCLFVFGWWVTLIMSLGAIALAVGFLRH